MKRKCNKCNCLFVLECFHSTSYCKDGKRSTCAKCTKERRISRHRYCIESRMKCRLCEDIIVNNVDYANLCEKHYRFMKMRQSAKCKNKYAPSYTELENLFEKQGLKCGLCNKTLNWSSKDSPKDRITLQHDKSGDIKFLCLSCNSRHAKAGLGDRIYELGIDVKPCNNCKIIKQKVEFYTQGKSIQPNCKICQSILRKERY